MKFIITGLFINFILCFFVAKIGKEKGVGYYRTMFHSLVFSPIIGLIFIIKYENNKNNDLDLNPFLVSSLATIIFITICSLIKF